MADIFVADFETLGTKEDSVLLSVGLAKFEEKWVEELVNDFTNAKCRELFSRMVDDGLYIKFDVREQVTKHKRLIIADTVQFWKEQGAAASKVLTPSKDDKHFDSMVSGIKEFLKGKAPLIYTRGSIDAIWYQSALRNIGIDSGSADSPIKWWNFRCVRTAVSELLQISRGNLPKGLKYLIEMDDLFVKHNAMHDSAIDALTIAICRIVCYTEMEY